MTYCKTARHAYVDLNNALEKIPGHNVRVTDITKEKSIVKIHFSNGHMMERYRIVDYRIYFKDILECGLYPEMITLEPLYLGVDFYKAPYIKILSNMGIDHEKLFKPIYDIFDKLSSVKPHYVDVEVNGVQKPIRLSVYNYQNISPVFDKTYSVMSKGFCKQNRISGDIPILFTDVLSHCDEIKGELIRNVSGVVVTEVIANMVKSYNNRKTNSTTDLFFKLNDLYELEKELLSKWLSDNITTVYNSCKEDIDKWIESKTY